MRRKLTALAGLTALGHLDFKLVRRGQVDRRHAEARRGHLLDLAVRSVPVRLNNPPRRILAALARVALGADAIHADRHRRVRLWRKRSERHRGGHEARGDLVYRLDLFQRDRVGWDELQQIAQRDRVARLHDVRVLAVVRVVAGLHGLVQIAPYFRVEGVVFAVAAVAVVRARVERGRPAVAECRGMTVDALLRQVTDTDAADARSHAAETKVERFLIEAYRLEDLGSLIAADRRNPHLGDNLQQRGVNRFFIVLGGLRMRYRLERIFSRRVAFVHERTQRRKREVRVDGAGAETDQQRNLVNVPRFAGFGDYARKHPLTFADQMMVHGSDREQHWNWRQRNRDTAIAEHQDRCAVVDRHRRLLTQCLQCPMHAFRACSDVE